MILTSIALMMAQAAPAANAPAASGTLAHDVQCLAAAGALANIPEADQATKDGASLLGTYYLGRIDGHGPQIDLAQTLTAETEKMKSMDIEALLKSCAALAQDRAAALDKIGAAAGK